MSAIVFDTETDAMDQPRVLEAAWVELPDTPMQLLGDTSLVEYCQRFNTERPISMGTMAVHHIIDADVVDAPSYTTFSLPTNTAYLIGHNIDFDWQVIDQPDIKRICTLALSRKLWGNLESYKQAALMFNFLPQAEARQWVKNAHNALQDVKMCVILLKVILQELDSRGFAPPTWDKLWQFSEAARIPDVLSFGKHKGTAISDVPLDYIQWYLKQDNIDIYLKKAFDKRLAGQ